MTYNKDWENKRWILV